MSTFYVQLLECLLRIPHNTVSVSFHYRGGEPPAPRVVTMAADGSVGIIGHAPTGVAEIIFPSQNVTVLHAVGEYQRAPIASIASPALSAILVGKYEACSEPELAEYVRQTSLAVALFRLEVVSAKARPMATIYFRDMSGAIVRPLTVPPTIAQKYNIASQDCQRADWSDRKIRLIEAILMQLTVRDQPHISLEYTADEYQCVAETLTAIGIPTTFSC